MNAKDWSVGQTIGAGVGIGAASSAANGFLGQIFGGIGARRQWKYQQKAMELQQKYALEQMQKQFEYQQKQFDYENEYNKPSNVFQRYRDAGINASAVLGGSGASVQSSMPMPSPPSGGSGPSGATGIPVAAPTQSIDALSSSQIIKNLAEADRADSEAALVDEQIPTQAFIRKELEARIGKEAAEKVLIETQNRIQKIVESHTDEKMLEEIELLNAQGANVVTQSGLNDAMAKYYGKAAANQAAQAVTQRAIRGYYSALTLKVNAETRILGLEYEDLQANIESLKRTRTVFFYEPDENGNKKRVYYEVSARDARFLSGCFRFAQSANDAYASAIDADWRDAEHRSDMILDWVDQGTATGSAIMSHGISYRRLNEAERHNREVERQSQQPVVDEYYGPDGDFRGGKTTSRR